ncbi:MAG: DUF2812 domain-containing protein [Clostridia bacterium]|nr:DUF2812 domain-containing protein [Clostridia bacterium]
MAALNKHFEEKAASGLILRSFGPTAVCRYEECEPAKLRYNAVICPVSKSASPSISEEARGFIEFCEESGWNFVDHRNEVYVFCTEDASVPDIETDSRELIASVDRAASRSRFISLVLIGMSFANLCTSVLRFFGESPDLRPFSIGMVSGQAVLLLSALVILIWNVIRDRKWTAAMYSALDRGEPIPDPDPNVLKRRRLTALAGIILIAALLLGLITFALISSEPDIRCFIVSIMIAGVVFALLAVKIKNVKVGKGKKALLYFLAFLAFIAIGLVLFGIFGSVFGVFEETEAGAALGRSAEIFHLL